MINHIRTLLLNATARGGNAQDPGEEYVPADFRPVATPRIVTRVRASLFGPSPDRSMMNYRLRQLLRIMHATELDEFMRLDDPRITYLPFSDDELYSTAFCATVTAQQGSGTLTVMGDYLVAESVSQLAYRWQVTVVDASTVRVVPLLPRGGRTYEYPYTLTDGLSGLIPLSGTNLQFNFSNGSNAVWQVAALLRPVRDLGTVLAELRTILSTTAVTELFGTSTAEPQATLRNLWQRHDGFAYQLGAVVLATAWATDAAGRVG